MVELKFLTHIAIQVRDYANAIRFYTDVLGMQILTQGPNETQLRCGELTLYVEANDRNNVFLAFEAATLDQAVQELKAAGCRLSGFGSEGQMVHDPYGLKFYLSAREDQVGD